MLVEPFRVVSFDRLETGIAKLHVPFFEGSVEVNSPDYRGRLKVPLQVISIAKWVSRIALGSGEPFNILYYYPGSKQGIPVLEDPVDSISFVRADSGIWYTAEQAGLDILRPGAFDDFASLIAGYAPDNQQITISA